MKWSIQIPRRRGERRNFQNVSKLREDRVGAVSCGLEVELVTSHLHLREFDRPPQYELTRVRSPMVLLTMRPKSIFIRLIFSPDLKPQLSDREKAAACENCLYDSVADLIFEVPTYLYTVEDVMRKIQRMHKIPVKIVLYTADGSLLTPGLTASVFGELRGPIHVRFLRPGFSRLRTCPCLAALSHEGQRKADASEGNKPKGIPGLVALNNMKETEKFVVSAPPPEAGPTPVNSESDDENKMYEHNQTEEVGSTSSVDILGDDDETMWENDQEDGSFDSTLDSAQTQKTPSQVQSNGTLESAESNWTTVEETSQVGTSSPTTEESLGQGETKSREIIEDDTTASDGLTDEVSKAISRHNNQNDETETQDDEDGTLESGQRNLDASKTEALVTAEEDEAVVTDPRDETSTESNYRSVETQEQETHDHTGGTLESEGSTTAEEISLAGTIYQKATESVYSPPDTAVPPSFAAVLKKRANSTPMSEFSGVSPKKKKTAESFNEYRLFSVPLTYNVLDDQLNALTSDDSIRYDAAGPKTSTPVFALKASDDKATETETSKSGANGEKTTDVSKSNGAEADDEMSENAAEPSSSDFTKFAM